MKIIEAVWEKRNLGVSCAEIEVGKTDTVSEVVDELGKRTEQYLVVKAPPGRTDLSFAIQNEGFRYIETMFELGCMFKDRPETPEICRRYVKDIGYHRASESETEHVFNEIRKGEIFSTDRISLDPAFSKQLAGKRYALWMEDVLSKGNATLSITSYQQEDIGFDIHVNKGRYFELLLGGYFTEYHGCGFGFAGEYVTINAAYADGAREIKTHVSSNNPYALRMHMLFGLQMRSLTDVYVKHN